MRGWRGWAAVLVWASMCGSAWACSCLGSGECGAIRPHDGIFVGKVVSETVVPREVTLPAGVFGSGRMPFPYKQVRIAVLESFTGTPRVGEELMVATGMGGVDCGYEFLVGERYLVDARAGRDG